jgi:pimeloyl-ACP methyl ester carboxylesterase
MRPLIVRWSTVIFGSALFASAVAAADEPASKTFDSDGVKIHYLIQGKGGPVLLIHGLHASANMNWKVPGVLADLAKTYQVIAIDLRGHGQSDRPDAEDAYGTKIVDDVVRLLDHLKIKKAHVVGYSLGGMVAIKLLTTHPDRVASAVVGGMGWFQDGSALQKVWDVIPAKGVITPPAFVRSVGKLAVTEVELKKIDVPVEVIVGDRDPIKGMFVEPLHGVRNDWPVVEIKGAGHLSCPFKDQFREEIEAWLKKQTKRDK